MPHWSVHTTNCMYSSGLMARRLDTSRGLPVPSNGGRHGCQWARVRMHAPGEKHARLCACTAPLLPMMIMSSSSTRELA